MTPPKIVPCELVSRGSIAMRIAGSEFMKGIVNGKRQMVNERGTKLSGWCLNRAVTNFPHERGFHHVYALRFDSGFSDRRVYLLPFPGRALRRDCGFRLRRVLVFGGMLAAIVVGTGASILLRRLKDKSPPAEFVSLHAGDTTKPKYFSG